MFKKLIAKVNECFARLDTPESVFEEREINGSNLIAWLKEDRAMELIKWLENVENDAKLGLFNSEKPFTNENLLFKQGEVRTLTNLIAKLKDIRSAKPETEETEETNG